MTCWRLGALLIAILSGQAAAQPVPELLPPPADPIEARLGAVAPPEPVPAPRGLEPGAAPTGATFRLEGIELRGATVLAPEALDDIWRRLIGRDVSLEDLEAVAEAIGARYRAAGFVLSQAVLPAQTVEDGIVRIEVIEGFVDGLTVEGGSPRQQRAAKDRIGRAVAARPLAVGALERGVLIARDTLGGSVETVLAPSAATFGAADMTVLLEPRPVSGFAALDTRGSRLYGDLTASAGLTFWNPLGLAERLDLTVSGDPGRRRVGYARGDAAFPLSPLDGGILDGAVLALRAEASRGEPGLAVPFLRVVSEEVALGAAIRVPFVRTRSRNLLGRIGLDWRRSDSATALGGDQVDQRDTLFVLEAGMSWDEADRFGGVTLVDLALRQGLDAASAGIGAAGEAAGSATFTRATARLARLQRLGARWSLFVEALGQVSGGVLPGGERFGLGGATIGRGFAPGNTTGDDGYGVRAELRRYVGAADGPAAELYAFADHGRARDRSLARDGRRWEGLSSVGIGARVDVAPWITLTPELVHQTDGLVADRPGASSETRGFIGIVARF